MSTPAMIDHKDAPSGVPIQRRVLIVHNAYQQRGGEDSVVDAELELLRGHGHAVEVFQRHNDELKSIPRWQAAADTVWSSRSVTALTETIRRFRPDVVHFHNTFPLISPAAYWAVRAAGLPVVQTLHNFRLMCLNALFLREGTVCEDCMGHLPWRGVARACYRGSRAASAVLAGMLTVHRGLGTYRNKVSRYIALNEFCRGKFIEGGLPAERVVVKPNFVDFDAPQSVARADFLFVGRLSVEKGVATLAVAIGLLPNARLRVAGDGPEAGLLEGRAGVTRLGNLSAEAVRHEMSHTAALVVPSIWYENFPRTIVEAFACGTPVIASRIGALAELVHDGETGLLFEPGDAADLAQKLSWAQAHPERMAEMGCTARAKYEAEFSATRNYIQLIAIYEEAISAVAKEIR